QETEGQKRGHWCRGRPSSAPGLVTKLLDQALDVLFLDAQSAGLSGAVALKRFELLHPSPDLVDAKHFSELFAAVSALFLGQAVEVRSGLRRDGHGQYLRFSLHV